MSTLDNLKFTTAKKPTHTPTIVLRRQKLSKRLWEQIQLVQAELQGKPYYSTRYKTVHDAATGLSRSVEQQRRVKQWFWTSDAGKICLSIRYGAKLIELAKGKNTVEVNNAKELVDALEKIKLAVELGELDVEIERASGALRAGFKR